MPPDDVSLTCRHLLICQSVWYDPAKPDEYSLGRLVVHLYPVTGQYPARFDRFFAYVQLFGTAGEYTLRVKLVRIELNEYDEEVEAELGQDGERFVWKTPRPVVVFEDDFVSQFAFELKNVRFPGVGTYEFQLFADDSDTPLTRERFSAREQP